MNYDYFSVRFVKYHYLFNFSSKSIACANTFSTVKPNFWSSTFAGAEYPNCDILRMRVLVLSVTGNAAGNPAASASSTVVLPVPA